MLKQEENIFFFSYGTLINENILFKVLKKENSHFENKFNKHNNNQKITIKSAILKGYACLTVREAHYPALVSAFNLENFFSQTLNLQTQNEQKHIVFGNLVSGLDQSDLTKLDEFEGDEYEKKVVQVELMDGIQTSLIDAIVYLYRPVLIAQNVSPKVWSYEGFTKNHLSQWLSDPTLLP
ncbi:hypothetical protein O181_003419 [Austropuccinia psidii MF-1]|uniref:Putative gamma-glutamylcyclotransferase n=1 Tax=Austropuccinia psidii MF-1 TaxID=1389203 RepID=A0A9Q3GDU8_9BASI|nr:hypothetical protein [Austropuccinia psidii MF-1]